MSHTNRIILLIDMDCFYCQVEENFNPNLKGKPIAVVQYNQWRGGGIIAVNYPARDKGVTRHMRGNDAKEKCPEIALVIVPNVRGKADLSKYRDAGKRVADVLLTFTPHLERASVDEAYLDITSIVDKRIEDRNDYLIPEKLPNTFVVGNTIPDFVENVTRHRTYNESNFKLAVGGVIAEEIRQEVFKVTGYKCSAGIAHNKILAKLVCGLHKPNKQTILPHEAVPQLYAKMPIRKITGLGGKFGNTVAEKLNIEYLGELSKFTHKELTKRFDEKSACWLYNLARGIDTDPVNTRLVSKSIGCCKKFPGKTALCNKEDIEHWLSELAEDIFERLQKDFDENGRRAKQMVVSFAHELGREEINSSKSHPLTTYDQSKILENAFKIVQKNCLKDDGSYRVTFLGISVGNFQDVKKVKVITSFFKSISENSKKENIPKISAENCEKTDFQTEKSTEHGTSYDSIYSCSTEEGDLDNENLIFYQQVHPESVTNQNYMINDTAVIEIVKDPDISEDSISHEIISEEQPNTFNATPTTSFFSKYFSNNIDRNFDTSKTLDNNDFNDSKDAILEDSKSTSDVTPDQNHIYEQNTSVQTDNTCPQCGKIFIDITDYQSHLDYHFAISIVKNEAYLYKQENKPQTSSSPVKSDSKKKKKEFLNASHKPIGDYFKVSHTEEGREEDTEMCKECKKRVALSEWDIHVDYHAAKKLHLDMNVNKSKPFMKKETVKSKFKGQKNIIGFFKPS